MQRGLRIAIHTLGTMGDVQPYLALALSLMRRGHAVQLAAPVQFESFAADRGIAFAPLPGEFLDLLDSPEGKAAVAGGQGFTAGFKLLKHFRPLMRRLLDAEWDAAKIFAPDAMVYHPKSLAAPHIGERLYVPRILASPLPGFTPTSAFPSPLLPFTSLGSLNRVSHSLAINGSRLLFGKMLRQWRQETLNLPKAATPNPEGTLYAYSPSVLAPPRDWGENVLVSGYWFLDTDNWTPPESLRRFLDEGAPPVYIGFGSMPGIDPHHMSSVMINALTQCGKRGVLATGGGALGIAEVPPHVHLIDHAPHDKLFPHVAATIHHGGAGTTGASLRAGKPMCICPFFGDQPFWGRLMHQIGVSPPPLDRKNLSAERVAAAIMAMQAREMRHCAAALGAQVRGEDGCDAAAHFIETRCAGP